MLRDLLRFWWKPSTGRAMVVLIHAGRHLDRLHRYEAREYLYELNEEKREESLMVRLHGAVDDLTGKAQSHRPFVTKCRELFQDAADRITKLETGSAIDFGRDPVADSPTTDADGDFDWESDGERDGVQ